MTWHDNPAPTFAGLERTLRRYAKEASADKFSATEASELTWTFRFWWD
jgi:hypothetical protein